MIKWQWHDWFNPFSWMKYFTQKSEDTAHATQESAAAPAGSANPTTTEEPKEEQSTKGTTKSARPPAARRWKGTTLTTTQQEVDQATAALEAIRIPGEERPSPQAPQQQNNVKAQEQNTTQDSTVTGVKKTKEKGKGSMHKLQKMLGDPFGTKKQQAALNRKLTQTEQNYTKAGENLKETSLYIQDAKKTNDAQQAAVPPTLRGGARR